MGWVGKNGPMSISGLYTGTYVDMRKEGQGVPIAEIFYVRPGLLPLVINFSLFVTTNNFSLLKGGMRKAP